MSVFLNSNTQASQKLYPDDTLIHSYNKKIFSDYDTAVDNLSYKVLLPGEVAFAYYYDNTCEYGINAIFAVGPAVHGSGNVFFHNAKQLDKIFLDLDTTIADVNVSMNRYKDDLVNLIEDVRKDLSDKVADCVDTVMGPQNEYKKHLDDLDTSVYDIKVVLEDKATIEQVNDLYAKHVDDTNDLEKLIENHREEVNNKFEQYEESIIKRVQDAIKSAVSQGNDNTDEVVGEAKSELQNAFKSLRMEYTDMILDVSARLSNLQNEYQRNIAEIRSMVINNTNNHNILKNEYDGHVSAMMKLIHEQNDKIAEINHWIEHHDVEVQPHDK